MSTNELDHPQDDDDNENSEDAETIIVIQTYPSAVPWLILAAKAFGIVILLTVILCGCIIAYGLSH